MYPKDVVQRFIKKRRLLREIFRFHILSISSLSVIRWSQYRIAVKHSEQVPITKIIDPTTYSRRRGRNIVECIFGTLFNKPNREICTEMQDVHLPGIVKNMIIPCYQNHILREDQKENIKKKKGGGIGGGAMAVCSQLFLL